MNLIDYLQANPVNHTYFAIGSCPHSWGNALTQREDQLLPLFFREWLQSGESLSFRVIHFDPAFKFYEANLLEYFETLGFESVVSPPLPSLQCWRSPDFNLEVFLFTDSFSHETDAEMLKSICESIVNEERIHANLVVQEYTGYSLEKLADSFHKASSFPEEFRKRILFDVSYGTDSGCMTDMSKHRPFLDEKGDFYNLQLLNSQQLFKLIGKQELMDIQILNLTIHEYRNFLNTYHVDYRRALRGEVPLFLPLNVYTNPENIMHVLMEHLTIQIQILQRLRHITAKDRDRFDTLLKDHKAMDVYKWYDAMAKLVRLSDYAQ